MSRCIMTGNGGKFEMAKFQRALSKELETALRELAAMEDSNWWKDVLDCKDLLLAVRGGYLNAYKAGQSIFKIGPEIVNCKPRVKIHYKYLVKPNLEENPYIEFDGEHFAVDPAEVVQTGYQSSETLRNLINTAARFSGEEKRGIAQIVGKEPKVVDVEIAFTRSGDPGKRSTAPRMDLAVLVPWKSEGARLVFCEAKCADNVELWKLEKQNVGDKPRIAVVSQIEKYQKFISENDKAVNEAYVSVCKTLIGLHDQKWNRKLDPLIKHVADQPTSLTIHPHVYLLVYAYGKDEKNGVLKNRLRTLRDKENLGDRVIAKGKANKFKLSDDIISRITAEATSARKADRSS